MNALNQLLWSTLIHLPSLSFHNKYILKYIESTYESNLITDQNGYKLSKPNFTSKILFLKTINKTRIQTKHACVAVMTSRLCLAVIGFNTPRCKLTVRNQVWSCYPFIIGFGAKKLVQLILKKYKNHTTWEPFDVLLIGGWKIVSKIR